MPNFLLIGLSLLALAEIAFGGAVLVRRCTVVRWVQRRYAAISDGTAKAPGMFAVVAVGVIAVLMGIATFTITLSVAMTR